MILDGIKLMVLGMGTVLVFLVVMIFFMNLLAKVLAPFAGALEKAAPAPKKKAAAKADDDQLKAAAAAAAIRAFQSGK
ncbi:MAG: OadG family protein [Victivallales bacterium]|jgi:sodium pump decarboxylase, gamma subunit